MQQIKEPYKAKEVEFELRFMDSGVIAGIVAGILIAIVLLMCVFVICQVSKANK